MPDLFPTFVIAGAARAGSTALAEQLRAHPQVWMTTPKEPHYLALAGERPSFTGPGDEVTINARAVVDEDAYRQLFAGADERHRARGDGSVSTLYYHQQAVPRLRELNPDARLVVMLRDPVDRAYSSHQYLLNRGFEPEPDFRAALAAEPERIRAGWHHLWHYAGMSHYADAVEHLVHAFGRDHVHLCFYDDFEADPGAVLAGLHEFLALDPHRPEEVARVNASGQERSRVVASVMHAAARNGPLRAVVRTVVPFGLRERIRNANLRRGGLPPAEREEVRQLFAADLDRLPEVIRRPLPEAWTR